MLHFESDYTRGACPAVLERLVATNAGQTPGYGADGHCAKARKLILDACGLSADEAEVQFLVGGTQTNATIIDGLLRHCQGVIAADSAHVNVHESGAIEASGHKVIALPGHDGKLDADEVDAYIKSFYRDDTWPHMTMPGMVYISHPTELGTLYSLEELTALSNVCRSNEIPLYMDGARMAYALGSDASRVKLTDIARLCDAFYIGGTKCGALFGEAAVVRKGLIPRLFSLIKQHGALLAKGRLLGVQFEALFTDGVYERQGRHAVEMAMKLRDGMRSRGYRVLFPSPTNQQFFVLPNSVVESLSKVAGFEHWGPAGDSESAVRFVVDWGTREEDVDALLAAL